MGGGLINQQQALARFTRQVLEEAWSAAAAVAKSGTAITVVLSGTTTVPTVGAGRLPHFAGAAIIFTSGANIGFETTVTSVTSTGGTTTVNITDALPQAVAAGDTFTIYLDGAGAARAATPATSAIVAMQLDATTTGQGTALPTLGYATALLDIDMTGNATIQFQATGPGGDRFYVAARYRGQSANQPSATGAVVFQATASGLYELDCRGCISVYANITSQSGGILVTVNGVATASPAPPEGVGVNGAVLAAVTHMQAFGSATGQGTALPVAGMASASIDLTITGGTATVTFQGVGPGGNTVSVPAQNVSTGAIATTATASGVYILNVAGLTNVYANITAISSSSVNAYGQASPLVLSLPQVGLVGSSVQQGNAAWTATQGIVIAGEDNTGKGQLANVLPYAGTFNGLYGIGAVAGILAAPVASGAGNLGVIKMLGNGNCGVLADPLSGTSSVAITTATTTSVKSAPGVIGRIINAGGAATTGTLTVYDNTSATGTPIIVIPAAQAQAAIINLGVPCGTGITIVTSAADTWRVTYA